MKTVIITLCCLCLQLGLAAQKEVIVLHVTGKALYFSQYGVKPVYLYPGMVLDLKGKVNCRGAGSAKLLYNGNTFLLSGTKNRDVQDVVKAAGAASQMSFTGRFFNFLTESVKEGDSNEKLEKHHRHYMNKTSGGIKGWAKQDYTLVPLLLTSGKLPSANVMFKWRNSTGDGPYTFTLYSAANKPIAQIMVRDTFITLDLDQLAISLDEEYTWEVARGANAKSPAIPFSVCAASNMDKQSELVHEKSFQAADATEQQLMQAYSLEEERCFYNANGIYHQLLANDPDNVLILRMYATFLARMDMVPEATSLISKIKN